MHYYLSRKLSGKYEIKTLSRSRGQNQITNATQEINCQEVSCDIYKHHWNLLFITMVYVSVLILWGHIFCSRVRLMHDVTWVQGMGSLCARTRRLEPYRSWKIYHICIEITHVDLFWIICSKHWGYSTWQLSLTFNIVKIFGAECFWVCIVFRDLLIITVKTVHFDDFNAHSLGLWF